VIAEAWAAGVTGLGYTYAAAEAAELINDTLAEVVIGEDAFATPKSWEAMVRSVRNLGWRGICATAISAVDVALWDLKARLLDRPLVQLLGATRSAVPIYGSGGFYIVLDASIGRATRRLGDTRRLPMGQDEGGKRTCARPATGARRALRHRCCRFIRRRQRRLYAKTGAAFCRTVRRILAQ
jgi:L-alanine-DL-glutamate epimerase-like enolase superfamily enzyme